MAPADPPNPEGRPTAANDNGEGDSLGPEALRKVDGVVLQLARIIGRRMAREDFATRTAAANDNTSNSRDGTGQDGDDNHLTER